MKGEEEEETVLMASVPMPGSFMATSERVVLQLASPGVIWCLDKGKDSMRSGIDVAVPLREAEVTFLTGGFIHSLADRNSCQTALFQDEVFSSQVNAPEMKGTRGKPDVATDQSLLSRPVLPIINLSFNF